MKGAEEDYLELEKELDKQIRQMESTHPGYDEYRYQLDESDIALISTASALHDIGKIVIPEEILNKPGRLTAEEFAIIKNHTVAGAQMLQDLGQAIARDEPLLQVAHAICRWHHERWDGNGYPDRRWWRWQTCTTL